MYIVGYNVEKIRTSQGKQIVYICRQTQQ